MRDFLGKEIKISDPVVFSSFHCRGYKIARVFDISSKMVFIYEERGELPFEGVRKKHCRRQFAHQLIKITEAQYRSAMLEKKLDIKEDLMFWEARADKDSEIFSKNV